MNKRSSHPTDTRTLRTRHTHMSSIEFIFTYLVLRVSLTSKFHGCTTLPLLKNEQDGAGNLKAVPYSSSNLQLKG
jgi:hypothetical protein